MKAKEIAQFVINNRYSKNEKDALSDSEMYHRIVFEINAQNKELIEENKELQNKKPKVDIISVDGETFLEYGNARIGLPDAINEVIKNGIEKFAEHQNKERVESLAKRDKIIIQQKEAMDYYIEIINSQVPTTIQKT